MIRPSAADQTAGPAKPSPSPQTIFDLIEKSPARLADTIRCAGLWLAMIDGDLDPRELHEVSLSMEHEAEGVGFEPMIAALSEQHRPEQALSRELPRIFRYLRAQRTPRKSEFLLDFFIKVAAADGGISQSERHALLFLSDVLAQPSQVLAERFEAVLGIEFEPPADLASTEPYERAEQEIKARHERLKEAGLDAEISGSDGDGRYARREQSEAGVTAPELSAAQRQAFVVLGLSTDSNPIQIKAAWRKLSQKNHPDRFAQADEQTQREATERFQQIQQALDVLVEALGYA